MMAQLLTGTTPMKLLTISRISSGNNNVISVNNFECVLSSLMLKFDQVMPVSTKDFLREDQETN